MTAAKFDDYMKIIGENDFQSYEKPGIVGNLKLTNEYLSSPNGLNTVRVKLIESAKNNGPFEVTATLIFSSTLSVVTGVWNYFPYMFAGGILGSMMFNLQELVVQVRISDDYREWKGKKCEEKVSEVFSRFLIEDPILNKLTCPISGDLPIIPVNAPDGAVYDQLAIVEHIRKKAPGVPASVDMYHDFTEQQLVFDDGHFIKVIQRIKILVEQELDRLDLEPHKIRIIKDGLMAYKISKDKFHKELFNNLLKQHREKLDMMEKKEDEDRARDIWTHSDKKEALYQEERLRLINCFQSYRFCVEDKGT